MDYNLSSTVNFRGYEVSKNNLIKQSTFPIQKINALKKFFLENHKAGRKKKDNLTTFNYAMKLLYPDRRKFGENVYRTMEILEYNNKVKCKRSVEFLDSNGSITIGVRKPENLIGSILDEILKMAIGGKGKFVFAISLIGGDTYAVLLLDKTDHEVKLVWCDRMKGYEEISKEMLDEMAEKITIEWWTNNCKNSSLKRETGVMLWMLK